MRRTLILGAVLLIAFCAAAGTAFADQSGPFEYALLEDGGAVILGYSGADEDVAVPSALDGHPVVEIGEKAFLKRDFIRKLSLPEGLKRIGDRAFASCTGIRDFVFPTTLEEIGPWAFVGCGGVASFTLPKGLTQVGDAAFSGCASLSAVRTEEGNLVFASPDGVLFNRSSGVLVCYPPAREGEEYDIPEGTLAIGLRAFIDCDRLRRVGLPSTLETIGQAAFSGCDALADVRLPASLREIGAAAFNWCTRLENPFLPAGLEAVDPYAFSNCISVSAFAVDASNPFFSAPGGALYDRNNAALLAYPPASSVEEYALPPEAKSVSHAAFMNCETLRRVVLPEGLESIGQDAFRNCSSLEALAIPASVRDIGRDAFTVWEGGFPLRVEEGSAAHAYALEYGLEFKAE